MHKIPHSGAHQRTAVPPSADAGGATRVPAGRRAQCRGGHQRRRPLPVAAGVRDRCGSTARERGGRRRRPPLRTAQLQSAGAGSLYFLSHFFFARKLLFFDCLIPREISRDPKAWCHVINE